MNPTPAVAAWIRGQVTDWGDQDAAIAAELNAVQVDNPAPAPMILPPLSAMVLFARVGPESRVRLGNYANLQAVRHEILTNQREPLCNWIQVLAACGVVTVEEASDCISYLNTPLADPSHPETLPQTVVALGRDLDAQDVAVVRYILGQEAIAARADQLQAAHPNLTRRAALEQADEEIRNGE